MERAAASGGDASAAGSTSTGHAQSDVERRLRLLSPYVPRLVRLARSRGMGQFDAEDLASETVLRVAQSRTFDGGSGRHWSYAARTLANLAVDQGRRVAAESGALERSRLISDVPGQAVEETVTTRVIAAQAIKRLLATESASTVRMVMLYALSDLTWQEIGAQCGTTATAARKRVGRALDRLRPWLTPRED